MSGARVWVPERDWWTPPRVPRLCGRKGCEQPAVIEGHPAKRVLAYCAEHALAGGLRVAGGGVVECEVAADSPAAIRGWTSGAAAGIRP